MTSVLLAALILVEPSRGLDTPISLKVNNGPLPAVVKQLTEQSGIRITVRGAPERDWIYLNVTQRPLRQVLDSLAKLTDSTWKVSEGEVYLQAPWPAHDAQIAKRQESIQAWMDKNPVPPAVTAEVAKTLIRDALALNDNKLPSRNQEVSRLSALTPINRAVRRIIEAVGAKELSTIPANESRTYTLDRRPRSHTLPSATRQFVADALQEREVLRREMELQNLNFENAQARENYLVPLFLYFFEVELEKYWCVTITNQQDMLEVNIRFFGGDSLFEQMSTGLSVGPLLADPPQGDDRFNKLEDLFPLPPEWKAACEREGLRNALLDTSRDPLTDYVHLAFDKAAESLDTDVAAIISDGSFYWASIQRDKTYSLGSVLREATMAPAQIITENGMTLFRPVRLQKSRLSRIDRPSLLRYLEDFVRSGDEDIDMAAALAVANPEPWAFMHAHALIGMSTDRGGDYFYDADALRVYGGLPEGLKQEAKQSGAVTLPYSNLSSAQKDALERMFAWPGAGLRDPGGTPNVSETSYFGRLVRNDIKLSLPTSIPADTPVLIRLASIPSVFAYEPELGVFETSASSLAYMKVFGGEEYNRTFKFAPADVKYLQVAANLGPIGWFYRSSQGSGRPGKNSKWLTLAEMPQSFLDTYNQQLAINTAAKKRQGGG